MGMEITVARTELDLGALLGKLAETGFLATILMVDGQLRMPNAPPPQAWRDVRIKTPAGTVTINRRPTGFAVLVFGNADAALQSAQRRIADTIETLSA